uniref:Uncharacterized protein n=1 Tax=Bionectria ochroleuca TaxID=29856 RepID=A0A8H7N675_BIOOC
MAIVRRKPTVRPCDINPERRQRLRSDSDDEGPPNRATRALEAMEDIGRYSVYYVRRGVNAGLDFILGNLKWILIALLFSYLADLLLKSRGGPTARLRNKYPCGIGGAFRTQCAAIARVSRELGSLGFGLRMEADGRCHVVVSKQQGNNFVNDWRQGRIASI